MNNKPVPSENRSLIKTFLIEDQERYVSLNDLCHSAMVRPVVIASWMRMRPTIEFLGNWEELHNPNFRLKVFVDYLEKMSNPEFNLKAKEWLSSTNSKGIILSQREQTNHFFAHPDIALEFAAHLNPSFRIYLLKEFQRLKNEENLKNEHNLKWSVRRELSKINYRLHAEAVKKLIPPKLDDLGKKVTLAGEADLLNIALFGMTAKEWRVHNTDKKGNMRDHASMEQLAVLANLENLNAYLIESGFEQDERLQMLNTEAIKQMNLMLTENAVKGLEKLGEEDKPLELE